MTIRSNRSSFSAGRGKWSPSPQPLDYICALHLTILGLILHKFFMLRRTWMILTTVSWNRGSEATSWKYHLIIACTVLIESMMIVLSSLFIRNFHTNIQEFNVISRQCPNLSNCHTFPSFLHSCYWLYGLTQWSSRLGLCMKGSLSLVETPVLTNSRDWKCKHCTNK